MSSTSTVFITKAESPCVFPFLYHPFLMSRICDVFLTDGQFIPSRHHSCDFLAAQTHMPHPHHLVNELQPQIFSCCPCWHSRPVTNRSVLYALIQLPETSLAQSQSQHCNPPGPHPVPDAHCTASTLLCFAQSPLPGLASCCQRACAKLLWP